MITGSPGIGEPVFLAVGLLRRPHGVHGEILMEVLTDFPERLEPGIRLFISPDHHPVHLKSVRQHSKGLLVSLVEYQTQEMAGELRNRLLMVRVDDRPPLPEGEFYHHQILGLEVYAHSGKLLGVVSEILETGANDVYVITKESRQDLLLPVTDEVILDVDLEAGVLRVKLIPGLMPDEE
ncbi:MAG: 16S rRNA processing protein RimM [Anaerolineales bacterium]|nr:16S rRNA processing protein RimM [Anaerolineales bacterium]